jgi:hypothetical protein
MNLLPVGPSFDRIHVTALGVYAFPESFNDLLPAILERLEGLPTT